MRKPADMKRFLAVLHAVKRVTPKTEAEIVNRALRDVGYRAAQFTPKTSAGKIRGELNKALLSKIAAKSLKEKQGRFTRAELRQEMAKILKARTSHVTALRAGWAKAIRMLGGNFRGSKPLPGGSANDGIAIPANPRSLRGLIRNAIITRNNKGTTGAAEIPVLVAALNQAIDYVSADREGYVMRKMRGALQKARKSVS